MRDYLAASCWAWLSLIAWVSFTSPAASQGVCNQLRQLSQQNASFYQQYNDPAHRAAASNYGNSYAAYCGSGGGTSFRNGGAFNLGASMAGMIGIIMQLGMPTGVDVSVPHPSSRAAIDPDRLDRLRAEADRELAEAKARCVQTNPFSGQSGNGCAAAKNPFATSATWDSLSNKDCGGVIDLGSNSCVPDVIRKTFADLGYADLRAIPKYKGTNYNDLVLSPEQYRRLAAGEAFGTVVPNSTATTRALFNILHNKLASRTGQEAGAVVQPANGSGAGIPSAANERNSRRKAYFFSCTIDDWDGTKGALACGPRWQGLVSPNEATAECAGAYAGVVRSGQRVSAFGAENPRTYEALYAKKCIVDVQNPPRPPEANLPGMNSLGPRRIMLGDGDPCADTNFLTFIGEDNARGLCPPVNGRAPTPARPNAGASPNPFR